MDVVMSINCNSTTTQWQEAWGTTAHPKIQCTCTYPKILIMLFVVPIRVTMMMITTRFSSLCVLDFVKEIVEDFNSMSVSFVLPKNTENLIPGAATTT